MDFFLLVSLAVLVLGIVLVVQGSQTASASLRTLGGGLAIAGVAFAVLSQALVIVPAGNVGVVFNIFGGVQDDELGEGLHVVLPVLQTVSVYDIRQQELTLAVETGDMVSARSSEGLEITVDATILFQPAPDDVARLHQDIGPSYETVRVRPEARTQIRDAIGQYAAAELISSQRTELQTSIQDALREALEVDNVNILSVLLRDVSIPDAITDAIEEKQAAEQQVEVEENRRRQAEISAQRIVVVAEGERDAAIARAEGEAEALRMVGEQVQANPAVIQLEVAQNLAPGIQTVMVPSDQNFLLDIRDLTRNSTQPAAGTAPAAP